MITNTFKIDSINSFIYIRFYAKGVLAYICPALTKLLTQQEEDQDEEEWNPAKAAGVCLMNMAQCCEADILEHVMSFIAQHMADSDWRKREAAIMAFGSVLEGPPPDKLKQYIDQAMPIIIERLSDESVVARDTAAWFVGRACDIVPEGMIFACTLFNKGYSTLKFISYVHMNIVFSGHK